LIDTSGSGKVSVSGSSAPTNSRNLGRIRESFTFTHLLVEPAIRITVSCCKSNLAAFRLLRSVPPPFQKRYRVLCWDAFTKNSDWVRRADLFEKDGEDVISCSRFGVWLMLAEERFWRLFR
jgi:hypothetical protein